MFKSWAKGYQNFIENLLKLSHDFKKPNTSPAEQEEQKNVNKIKSGNPAYAYTVKKDICRTLLKVLKGCAC